MTILILLAMASAVYAVGLTLASRRRFADVDRLARQHRQNQRIRK